MTISKSPAAPRGRGAAAILFVAVLAAAPVRAGPPFRTDDPEPVDFRHFEVNPQSFGTKTNSGWTGVLPGYEMNYGALPNLQLHVILHSDYNAPTGGQMAIAMGDIELGAKYRFITPVEGDWFPQAAIFPQIEVPTGNQNLDFSTGHAQVFLPLWLQKDFDPWTVYGGGGYWINPGARNKNYAFYGVALWRKVTEQFNIGIEVFHQTSSAAGVKESTGFNVGSIYDLSENWHLLSSVGTGIQNRTTTNQFSYYLALQLTF